MIGYLHGKVLKLDTDYCLLDVHGVGYRVFVGGMTRSRLRMGEDAELFIHTAVREDAILLYGFQTSEEYDTFQLLLSVSGIGPKVALGILSAITVEQLALAIRQKKSAVLTKLPGIGKKSAERIILELKDKVAVPDGMATASETEFDVVEQAGDDMMSEAGAALAALGYTQAEIAPVLKKAATCDSVEAVIKFALKELNKF